MNNKYLIYSGISIALTGLVLLLSQKIGVQASKIAVPILIIISSYFSYKFSRSIVDHNIGKQFHLARAGLLFIFGVIVAFVPDSLESFLSYVVYFMMFFFIFEFTFCLMSFNTAPKVNWRTAIFWLISGFLAGIGAVLVLSTSITDPMQALMMTGVFMVLSGLSFAIFAKRLN